ncbi:MAG: sulfatase family protein [Limisphaerales bacterium]
MNRIVTLLTLILCLPALAAKKQYNLLVIQTDEHNYRTLSCYQKLLPQQDYYFGTDVIKTPNIDWLADNGAICTSFYATTPVCSPSRAALISGRYPQNTPVVTNNIKLSDEVVTFAEILRRAGYSTGYSGKWHLDGNGKPQWGPKRNFGFEDNRFMFNRGHWKKFEDTPDGPRVGARDKNGNPSYSVDDADKETFATDWLANKTIDFINTNAKKPFCYMVSFPDPHGPNTVRAPYDTKYGDAKVPTPESTLNKTRAQTPAWAAMTPRLTADTVRTLMPKYFGMVECLDDNIGRIIDTLRKQEILDRTIIVLTSDHGDLCGEHGRLNKGVPYEGSARIPFLFYVPGQIKGGTVVNEALSCVDFLPTVFDFMGQKTAGLEQGRNAAALFLGKPQAWNDIAYIRSTGDPGNWIMATSDRFKLVFAQNGRPWLFDLEEDPDELNNALDKPEHRALIRRFAKGLKEYTKKYDDPVLQQKNIALGVEWAIGNEKTYTGPEAKPAPAEKKNKKKRNRKKA